ncbi:MAG: hypothetical protein J7575_04470, partial [Chloroflexi bacterium]|nr:hypothetical protein [Chloroflexota bacterium]
MNLLFLTSQVPYPPRQGGALRAWGMISALARRHRVTILSFHDTAEVPPLPPDFGDISLDVVP